MALPGSPSETCLVSGTFSSRPLGVRRELTYNTIDHRSKLRFREHGLPNSTACGHKITSGWRDSRRLLGLCFCFLSLSAASFSQTGGATWTKVDTADEPNVLSEASLAGTYAAGSQTGGSKLLISCEQRQRFCMDCRSPSGKTEAVYRFTWIIPAVASFWFEPFTLGLGHQQDLAKLGVSHNPPTPRHSSESVTSDGHWKISIDAKPEDITALKEQQNVAGKMTLVLANSDTTGVSAITIRNVLPHAESSALESVLNACSNSVYPSIDTSSCEPISGKDLIQIKVCSGGTTGQRCDDPKPSKSGAIWHLNAMGGSKAAVNSGYRLTCGYKDNGSPDVVTSLTDFGLSSRLKECDESLKPLAVFCK